MLKAESPSLTYGTTSYKNLIHWRVAVVYECLHDTEESVGISDAGKVSQVIVAEVNLTERAAASTFYLRLRIKFKF